MSRLSEPCRLCRSRDDVRLVRPRQRAPGEPRKYGRAIALCAECRKMNARKWKWPSEDAAREAGRATKGA